MDNRGEAINRMLRILDRFVRKFKIAICSPMLIEKPKFKCIFERHCDTKELKNNFYELCDDANGNNGDERIDKFFLKDGTLYEVIVCSLIFIHTKFFLCCGYADRLEADSRWAIILEDLSQHEDEIFSLIDDTITDFMPTYTYVMSYMELLTDIVEWQMKTSPKQLRARKTELRNAEALVAAAQDEINQLEIGFADETLRHDEAVEKSRGEIADLNAVIDETERRHREQLEREMQCYREKLAELRKDIAEEECGMVDQLEAHEAMIEQLTRVNVEHEKLLRRHCIKTEKIRLLSRNAYDRDLSKLNELKETLELQLRVTNNHFDILQNEYDVQSVLYVNLKKERELSMMQAFAEQIDNFKKKRAACIIQRTWRAYHERVSSKKKKRSRKNK